MLCFVSVIAIFVLKGDVKLQLTTFCVELKYCTCYVMLGLISLRLTSEFVFFTDYGNALKFFL